MLVCGVTLRNQQPVLLLLLHRSFICSFVFVQFIRSVLYACGVHCPALPCCINALQLAEMVQHLEICQVMAMACATYKSHPHLLQFFAPHAAVGGIELPAAVYLVDVMKPGPHISQLLELVRPVLASTHNTKVRKVGNLESTNCCVAP